MPQPGSATPSAGPRPPHQDDLLLHHLQSFLGIMDAAIDAVRGRVRRLQLSSGETLMRQGKPGDALRRIELDEVPGGGAMRLDRLRPRKSRRRTCDRR